MNSKIKVSVIIPTHNREKTIKYCLESVLRQTFSQLEIIVVDDCSTDETERIVKSISDNRIRLIKLSSKRGAQAARNAGIKDAKGEYIAFLDSDDEWLPEKLELQVKELEFRKKPCIIHSDAWIFFEETGEKRIFGVPKLDGLIYKKLLTHPGPLYPCMLVPRDCFEKIGFLDENVPSYQEWDTSLALAKYYEFIFIDKPLMIYHIHSGETISKDKIREAEGWRYIVEKYKNDIITNVGKKVLARHYFQIGMLYYRAGEFSRAKTYFYKAFFENYKNPKLFAKVLIILVGGESVFKSAIRIYRFLKTAFRFR